MKFGLMKILLFNESRKVGLGIWIYFTATPLFIFSVIFNALHTPVIGALPVGVSFEQYLILAGLSTSLVGGGTLADKWMDKKPNPKSDVPAAS